MPDKFEIGNLNLILDKLEKMYQIKDIHSLLDNILYETRKFTNADAGTIFLVTNDKLKYSK